MPNQESRSAKSFHAAQLPTARASYIGRICQVIPTGKTYKCVEDSTSDPVVTESHSPALGTVTVNATTFASKISQAGTYIFDATVDAKHIIAVFEGISQRFDYYFEGVTDVYEAWRNNEGDVVYTDTSSPNENDPIYQGGGVVVGYVEEHSSAVTSWELGQNTVTLATYGISFTGTALDGSAIFVTFKPAGTTYKWDEVTLEIGGTKDTLENHLNSLRNDLGDLGDDVDVLEEKVPDAPMMLVHIL